MPYCPRFELGSFDALGPEWKRGILGGLVESLVLPNRAYLRDFPHTPGLYDAGIPYVFNRDRWQDIPTMLQRGEGDCKDFTAWRVAELRQQGERAAVHVTDRLIHSPDGKLVMYHVLVRRPQPDGTWRLEDPSRMLGMDEGGASLSEEDVPSLFTAGRLVDRDAFIQHYLQRERYELAA